MVQYYGSLWAEKNRLWILMEYCQAGSVRDLMETINLPSMKEKQIAFVMHTTLQVSHESCVHRHFQGEKMSSHSC